MDANSSRRAAFPDLDRTNCVPKWKKVSLSVKAVTAEIVSALSSSVGARLTGSNAASGNIVCRATRRNLVTLI